MLVLPDVSEFQGIVAWPTVAAYLRDTYGAAAGVVRLSNGYRPDVQADANIDGARTHLDVVGWYAYLIVGVAPSVQADIFCRVLQAHGGLRPGEFVVCDCEEGSGDMSSWVNSFLDRCDQNLQQPNPEGADWWYSGAYFASAHLPAAKGHRWIAAYGPDDPGLGRDLWQFTSDGSLPGISGSVDLSRFDGSVTDLKALIEPLTPTFGGTTMFRPAGPLNRSDSAYISGGHVWHLWRDGNASGQIEDKKDRGSAPNEVPFVAIVNQGWDQASAAYNVEALSADGQIYWAFWPFDPANPAQDWTPLIYAGGVVKADLPAVGPAGPPGPPIDPSVPLALAKLTDAVRAAGRDLGET